MEGAEVSESEPSLVEQLIAKANETEDVRAVLDKGVADLKAAIVELNAVLRSMQPGGDDVGAQVVRSIIIRGTLENMISKAFETWSAERDAEKAAT